MDLRLGRLSPTPHSRPALGYAFGGGLAFLAFACIANETTQLALLGFLLCFCAVMAFAEFNEQKISRITWEKALAQLPIPLALAKEAGFLAGYENIADSMTKIVQHRDRLFLELA